MVQTYEGYWGTGPYTDLMPGFASRLGHNNCFTVLVTVMTQEAIKYTGCIGSTQELGVWAKIVAVVRNLIKNLVPEGYQDQNGFHFGVERPE